MKLGSLVVAGMIAAPSVTLGAVSVASACGGGLVTTTTATNGSVADAQRIVVSMHGGMTDIVTQIDVPDTSADYAALLPMPAEPTIDPEPVSSRDLDSLDEQTAPQILVTTVEGDDGGFSLTCMCAGSSTKDGGNASPVDARVSRPVEIGPVTAVALTANDGATVRAWLSENGFVLPDAQAGIIDEYAAPGRYFVAIRRSASAVPGGPSSVGVHFTLPLELAELPLRFARLGAARTVSFTLFVAGSGILVPEAPVKTLDLDALEENRMRLSYPAAVAEASTRDGIGFVLEGSYSPGEIYNVGATLTRALGPTARVTRLTTILPASKLTEDVRFVQTQSEEPPRQRMLSYDSVTGAAATGFWLALFFRRPRRWKRRV